MKVAIARLESLSPYSQSRRVGPRLDKESWDDYEERIWRDRMHRNGDASVVIPPMAFKRSLESAAKFLRIRIPGKGQSEYGKHFVAGVLVPEPLVLPIKVEQVECEKLYLSSRGKRGEADVLKWMPMIPHWSGEVEYYVLDDTIGREIFEKHLTEAGNFIGLGRFRPENGGYYGRYKVKEITWTEE